jgi:hypothetical protein
MPKKVTQSWAKVVLFTQFSVWRKNKKTGERRDIKGQKLFKETIRKEKRG